MFKIDINQILEYMNLLERNTDLQEKVLSLQILLKKKYQKQIKERLRGIEEFQELLKKNY